MLTCLWLMACSPADPPKAHFTTYLTRVAKVLEAPAPVLQPPPALPALPAQRKLTIPVPRIRSGLIETLKLNHCDILGLVALHNSPLGKSQTSAWQFAYHFQFQQQLQQCLVQLTALPNTEQEEELPLLISWLNDLAQKKAPQLSLYYWNMMVAEPDIRDALSPASKSLAFSAQPGFQETLRAFQLFKRLHQSLAQASSAPFIIRDEETASLEQELSQALKGLYKNDYLGQLFYSLHASAHYLEQSIEFLSALDTLHCQGAQAIKGERLNNAMQHYYIKDIQAYLAQLDRQFVALAPLIATSLSPLEPQSAHKAQRMAAYRTTLASGLDSLIYVRYRDLTLEHAKVWQHFLKRCQLSPTRR
ncbi:DUF3080 family protein [Oceanisphaera avium]|uniref:DUF3080 family protein n=1 Tax=Oceanisphaera avium TaxID=1903694 RepID=UPI001E476A68|nr:DUF3080 family protein [Oceanisphaera avium]